ncbi:hypothetical protein [Dactylosporangium sp. NPDC000521]|uniref:hypothetical protein n=1 Tax=Dactylosporangium sp. NPDC000521 TaxID=3363975 RepID=UPI0036880448
MQERYERVYSAAARMLTEHAPAAGRAHWPQERRRRWSELEMLLTALPRTTLPGTADPAWQLASAVDEDGRPVGIADAVRAWEQRITAAPPPAPGTVVAMPGLWHTLAGGLLRELTGRLAPGRPAVTVGAAGGELSAVAAQFAAALRTAVTGAPHPPRPRPSLRGPRPLATGLPMPAAADRLEAAARLAAAATPSPRELAGGTDFSVRFDAADAAAQLLGGLYRSAGPDWRERAEGLRPAEHLVSSVRFDGDVPRPVGLAEHAAGVRDHVRDLRGPWRPGPDDPVPRWSPQRAWVVLPDVVATVTADLLDELAVRLRPGRQVGTVRFDTEPLGQFVQRRLLDAAIRDWTEDDR